MMGNKQFVRSIEKGQSFSEWHKIYSTDDTVAKTICGKELPYFTIGQLFDKNSLSSMKAEGDPEQTLCVECFCTTKKDWPKGEQVALEVLARIHEVE